MSVKIFNKSNMNKSYWILNKNNHNNSFFYIYCSGLYRNCKQWRVKGKLCFSHDFGIELLCPQ